MEAFSNHFESPLMHEAPSKTIAWRYCFRNHRREPWCSGINGFISLIDGAHHVTALLPDTGIDAPSGLGNVGRVGR
jgi:hypothetical protein